MIYIVDGKISQEVGPSLLHLTMEGLLSIMEYTGSSAWKELVISQVEEYLLCVNLMKRIYMNW